MQVAGEVEVEDWVMEVVGALNDNEGPG